MLAKNAIICPKKERERDVYLYKFFISFFLKKKKKKKKTSADAFEDFLYSNSY